MAFNDFLKYTGLAGALGLYDRKKPQEEADFYYQQIPGEAAQYLSPYTQRGEEAYSSLMPIYEQLANDPQALLSQILGDYKESPAYQSKLQTMMGALQGDAAAGGYAGTDRDMRQRAELAERLASEDYWNWAKSVMGQQQMGLQGLSDVGQVGYGSATNQADIGTQALATRGGMSFQGASQSNKLKNDLLRSMFEGIFGYGGSRAGKGGF